MKKKILLASCITTALLNLVGCGTHKSNASHSKSSLTLNLAEDLSCLDPRQVRTLKDLTLMRHLYEGLTTLDPTGKPTCGIAEKIECSTDGKTYTFYLRDSEWTDGTKLTAYDFERSWEEVLSPQFASDYFHMLYPIKNARSFRQGNCAREELGIQVVDEKTLKVELEHPLPYFLELTAFPTYYPIPLHKNTDLAHPEKLVFNGAFYLSSWTPQASLHLQQNPHYWNAQEVHLEEITFYITSDSLTEAGLFDKGEIDWLGQPLSGNLAADYLEKKKEEGKLASFPVAGTRWFIFNTQKPPFHNAKIRKAFCLAINRQAIITHLLQGNQQVATGPVPLSMALHQLPYFQDGDLTTAKQLFEEGCQEEGWTKETMPQILLSNFPSERNNKTLQFIQQEWQNAFGVTIPLESVEYHAYRKKIKLGDYQVGPAEWIADFHDPIAFLELFKDLKDDQGNGLNDTGWHQEEYTHLLQLAEQESNVEKRWAYLQQAEKILIDEMPIIPLYHYSFDYVKADDIEGVAFSPLGLVDFRQAYKK